MKKMSFFMRKLSLVLTLGALSSVAVAQDAETSGSVLTLCTYNIHSGIPNKKNQSNHIVDKSDMRNIADILTSSGAQIIGLQEVRNRFGGLKKNPSIDMPRTLAGLQDMHYVFGSTTDDIFNPQPIGGLQGNPDYIEWGSYNRWTNNGARHGEYGNAILSSLSFKDPENFAMPLDKPGTGEEQRCVVRVELEKPLRGLGTVVIYNTHLHHASAASRQKQMDFILSKAVAEPAHTTVFIMGDLNATLHPQRQDIIKKAEDAGFIDLAAAYSTKTGKPADNTIPAHNPDARIDYILCNKDINVLEVYTIPTEVSDHLPLVVKVSPK